MNVLENILADKRDEIAARKKTMPLAAVKELPLFSRRPVSMRAALRRKKFAAIAEIKKASPSKRVIRVDFHPSEIARGYVAGGASAISVLTDEKYFQGSLGVLGEVRRAVEVPLLRKDFIIDPYQLYETKAAGADAVLLIVAALDRWKLAELINEAAGLGVECLVEVHNEREVDLISDVPADLIGINNRDLTTFETSLEVSFRLRELIPPEVTVVSESGIQTADDLRRLISHDIHAFLIGEALMRAEDPGATLASLLAGFEEEIS
jgi:indole-3-glycerol phosphate synthase